MLRDVLRSNKLDEPWLGPYTIVRHNAGLYCLRDFAGGIFHRDVPRDHLKLIDSDIVRADEKDTYYVDRIVDHRVIPNDDHTSTVTQYSIKFISDDSPSWTDAADIHDQDLIRKYFADKQRLPRNLFDKNARRPRTLPATSGKRPPSTRARAAAAAVLPFVSVKPDAVSPSVPSTSVAKQHIWSALSSLDKSSRRRPNTQLRDGYSS